MKQNVLLTMKKVCTLATREEKKILSLFETSREFPRLFQSVPGGQVCVCYNCVLSVYDSKYVGVYERSSR